VQGGCRAGAGRVQVVGAGWVQGACETVRQGRN
jgi:hypothetical protein